MTTRLRTSMAPRLRGRNRICADMRLAPDGRSAERDLTHVDPDQERIPDRLIVAFERIDAPLRGNDDPVHVAVIGGIVQAGRAAEDVHRVVVPAEQAIRAKARDLRARVTLDAIGEGDLQAAPDLALHLDWSDL